MSTEATSLGKIKKRLWCLLGAKRVAVEAGDVNCLTPLINHRKGRLEADRRGRLGKMVPNGHHRVDRRVRRGLRDRLGRPGLTVVVLRGLLGHLVLLVQVRLGLQGRRALRGNHSPVLQLDGCVRAAVVIHASVLAGTTQSR